MRRFKEKLNKKGFTLAELLIVVAIIAVLVAVSVPVFNSKLEKSREAVDVANMRAAKVAAAAAYLNDEIPEGDTVVYYDAENGTIVPENKKPKKGYGQGKKNVDGKTEYLDYTGHTDAENKVLKISIKSDSDAANVAISMEWESVGSSTSDPD